VPADTEFVTVVCAAAKGISGDGAVSRRSQWPRDLQDQRIACVCVQATHTDAMVHDDCVKVLCDLAKQPQPRWSEARVRDMRKELGFPVK
jgi:hypothetical protein